MKRFLLTLLTAALLTGSLAACGGTSANPATSEGNAATEAPSGGTESGGGVAVLSAPGEFPIVTEPAALEVVMVDEVYIGELQTNGFASWYQEKTGVNVTYTEVPAGTAGEKVNLMIASNDLPDIFMQTAQQVSVNGPRGVYIPLNDLIDQYGVETKKVFEEYPDFLPGLITAVDGNIYAMPTVNACFHCMHNLKMWINTQWIENLGIKIPETTEEFREVLRAFRDGDPRGDGTKVVPMSGAGGSGAGMEMFIYPFLMNSFVPYYHDAYHYLDEAGTVQFVANTEDFREGLRYIRSLVSEGLIDPLAITQTPEQLMQLGSDPSGAMIGAAPGAVWWQVVPTDAESPDQRSRQYDGLNPLKGPNGLQNSPLKALPVSKDMAVITKAAKDPALAFRWLDGLYNQEVTLHSQIGREGENWDTPPEGSVGINMKPALYIQHWYDNDEAAVNANARMDNILMANRSSDFRLGEMADWNDPETQWAQEPRLYAVTNDHYVPFAHDEQSVPPVERTEAEGERYNLVYTQLNDYIKENIALFLAGSMDIEKDWDSYVAQLDALNWQEYIELVQTAYDRQYK